MFIKKIKIKNYRCYKDFTITFNQHMNIIVGNNESGKSTILEAINLAFSGLVNGKNIRNELSENYINREVVRQYISDVKSGKKPIPPEVFIEVYLEASVSNDVDEHYIAAMNGIYNSDGDIHASGFRFSIAFSEEVFGDEYNSLLDTIDVTMYDSVPIEYYDIGWRDFADNPITPRSLPFKSALIDSTNRLGNENAYLNYIVKDALEREDINSITQAHRHLRDVFKNDASVSAINSKINHTGKLTSKEISLAVEVVTKNAWISSLVAELDEVPFSFLGQGEQSIVKTELALNRKKSINAGAILLEEPENHLSHTNLNKLLNQISEGYPDKQFIVTTHNSFVANKLGLSNLILLSHQDGLHHMLRLDDLSSETQKFFKQVAGYDTLRLLLCDKVILCEGDSDELIIQKYYLQKNGKLPIEDGIEVISVGTSFLRFVEVADKLHCKVSVVTDNDGDVEGRKKKYSDYIDDAGKNKKGNIQICIDWNVHDETEFSGGEKFAGSCFNFNTLEPEMLLCNGLSALNEVFGKTYGDDYALLKHMHANKTECALIIFNTDKIVSFPEYIREAFE